MCDGVGELCGFPAGTQTASLVDGEHCFCKIIIQIQLYRSLWGLCALALKRKDTQRETSQRHHRDQGDEFSMCVCDLFQANAQHLSATVGV